MTGPQVDQPGRIVVVDDDPTVADVVERYLMRDGHSVQSVRAATRHCA
jgi:DNA-binding NtrC family response regulator